MKTRSKILLFLSLVLVANCAALPNRDLRKSYIKTVRELGFTPVYPPREEFQVGDVYIRSYNPKRPNDLKNTLSIWIGTLDSVHREANGYMTSRIVWDDTTTQTTADKTSFEVKPGQKDFSNGVVRVNSTARTTLPQFAIPSITGQASSAGALGGLGFLQSFGLGLGSATQVSLDFTDTRAFGLPLGGATLSGTYENEYIGNICQSGRNSKLPSPATAGMQRLELLADGRMIPRDKMCANGRICDIAVVTRTFLTRQLIYNYSSAQITRLAATKLRNDADASDKLVATPNVNLDVTIPANAGPQQVEAIVQGLSAATAGGGVAGAPSNGLNFLGFRGNSLAFSRTYTKPVAVAYESVNFNLNGSQQSCGILNPSIAK